MPRKAKPRKTKWIDGAKAIEKARAATKKAQAALWRDKVTYLRAELLRPPKTDSPEEQVFREQMQAEIDAWDAPFGEATAAERSAEWAKPVARALTIRRLHPDWTDEQVAKEVGLNRTSLFRFTEYKNLKQEIRRRSASVRPVSQKNVSGRTIRRPETGEIDIVEAE
jgi:hypothetical protein